MTMAMPSGSELTVRAEGPDEKTAIESICELFDNRFGETE